MPTLQAGRWTVLTRQRFVLEPIGMRPLVWTTSFQAFGKASSQSPRGRSLGSAAFGGAVQMLQNVAGQKGRASLQDAE